jgi:hypothetical protein
MDIVFEALYFLAIGLLAITITVFVLAVSLLGRAVKLSLEDQEKAENERKADTERTRAELKGTLEQATYNRESLEKSLKEYKKKIEKHDRTLRWIRWKPNFLKANWGVFVPCSFFIIAIGISAFARYQLGQLNTDFQYLYLGLSLFAFSFGTVFICLTLKVIEGVAITSEETAFTREAEAFKKALVEIEEAKNTELNLEFVSSKPPFKVQVNSEMRISCDITIRKGYLAKNPEVYFFVPKGFTFSDKSDPIIIRDEKYLNYISFKKTIPDLKKPFGRHISLALKSPSKSGVYQGVYRLNCEGFYSEYIEFEIIVE